MFEQAITDGFFIAGFPATPEEMHAYHHLCLEQGSPTIVVSPLARPPRLVIHHADLEVQAIAREVMASHSLVALEGDTGATILVVAGRLPHIMAAARELARAVALGRRLGELNE